MGRRRIQKDPITSINIYVADLDTISKLKNRRETQYDFIRRLMAEWQDLKDYRLDMDQVIRLKDRQITNLEYELKERLTNQNL